MLTACTSVLQGKSREYQGDVKMRFTLTALQPLDYAAHARILLDAIAAKSA